MKINEPITCLGRFQDEDGTEKFVFEVEDKGIIEVAWIKNKLGIDVLCLPTHYYCTLGCKFCHLTQSNDRINNMGSISVLDLYPIIQWINSRYLTNEKCLLSFMGVGEPLFNPHLILGIYKMLNDDEKKKMFSIALSTIVPEQRILGAAIHTILQEKVPTKIHFSLHSPDLSSRRNLLPKSWIKIDPALLRLYDYATLCSNEVKKNLSIFHDGDCFRELCSEIHYTLIDGINDSEDEYFLLKELGQKFHIPLKFLKFNPIGNLKRSPKEELWIKELKKEYEAKVSAYSPPGSNIGSSCGQFTKHYYLGCKDDKEREEFETWKKMYRIDL